MPKVNFSITYNYKRNRFNRCVTIKANWKCLEWCSYESYKHLLDLLARQVEKYLIGTRFMAGRQV